MILYDYTRKITYGFVFICHADFYFDRLLVGYTLEVLIEVIFGSAPGLMHRQTTKLVSHLSDHHGCAFRQKFAFYHRLDIHRPRMFAHFYDDLLNGIQAITHFSRYFFRPCLVLAGH